jgi:hypothetical protein
MASELPRTPADALQLSSRPLHVLLITALKAAKMTGIWRRAPANSAAVAEEMTTLDNLYWVYKSRFPITRPEPNLKKLAEICRDRETVALPHAMQAQQTLTISACGDILRSPGIENSKDLIYEKVQGLLFDPDISYANFESPITRQDLVEEVIGDGEPPTECCSQAQFDILKGHNSKKFDLLNLANNHMNDMGNEGIETTLRVIAREGIAPIGVNGDPDRHGKATIIVRNGIKLGFVSATFGLNGRNLAPKDVYRIHVSRLLSKRQPPDLGLLQSQIDDCRKQGCDFIVASMHWGHEFEFFPRAVQVTAARALVEYGADAILCHHPHVIQPVEYYRTKRDPDRVALIAYSLGSLTWGFMAPHLALSLVLNLKVTKGLHGGQVQTYLEDVKVVPVARRYLDEDGVPITRIERLSDHAPSEPTTDLGADIAQMKRFADLVLGHDGW